MTMPDTDRLRQIEERAAKAEFSITDLVCFGADVRWLLDQLREARAERSIAQRCFDSDNTDVELFEKVNRILGVDPSRCTDSEFKWGASDTSWDEYDGSIEVVRPLGSEWMTDDQADQILSLGFRSIFESMGEEARHGSKGGNWWKCCPRMGDEEQRLRMRLKESRAREAAARAQAFREAAEHLDEQANVAFEVWNKDAVPDGTAHEAQATQAGLDLAAVHLRTLAEAAESGGGE